MLAGAAARRRPEITPRMRAILQGILNHDNGIERRSLALDSLDESFDLDPDTLHRRFVKHAPALASQAARRALDDAGSRRATSTRCS
jgi:alkylresorcinol/alkylpyrone synthase